MDVEGCVEEGDTGAGVVDDLMPGGQGGSVADGRSRLGRARQADGRKVVRGCGFSESAIHGGRVPVADPFEEKDERIDRSGVRKSSVSRVE